MAKIIGEVALVAGAIALDVFSAGVATALTDIEIAGMGAMVTSGMVTSAALSIGMMGAGMIMSSISAALAGGGVASAQSTHNPAGSRKTIYGTTRTNGVKIYESMVRYSYNQIIAWASHPCQQVSYVYLDGREVYVTGNNHQAIAGAAGFCDENTHYTPSNNPYNFYASSGNYHVYTENAFGTPAGHWFAGLGTGVGSPGDSDGLAWADPLWTNSCTLNGICATLVISSSNPNMFANLPGVKAMIQGKNNIYDPRAIPVVGSSISISGMSNTTNNGVVVVTSTTPASNGVLGTFTVTNSAGVTGGILPNSATAIGVMGTSNLSIYGATQSGTSTTYSYGCNAWTANAALIIADFLCDSDYGMGYLMSEIDIPQLIAAANICDQQVPLATPVEAWMPSHTYTPGQIVMDSNGRQQQCLGYYNGARTGGVSSGSESDFTWATGFGQTTRDNQIEWLSGILGSATSEAMYQINGEFEWAATPGDTLAAMLEACAGRIGTWNGLVKIFPGAWQGNSGVSYGLADMMDKVSFKQKKYRDLCNAVRGKYICPSYPYAISGYDSAHKDTNIFDGQFQPTDAPEYAQDSNHGYAGDANLAADDGIKLYQDRSYTFVQSVGQAQRLMKIYLLRNRYKWSGTIRVNAKGLQNAPNDVITLTLPQYNWVNHLFEITEVRHVPKFEDGKPPVFYWEFDVQETDPSIYNWSTSEERSMTNSSSPTLADNLSVPAIVGLELVCDVATSLLSADGYMTPQILATWTESVDPFVTGGGFISVQYQLVGASAWTQAATLPGTATSVCIGGVIAGQSYNVQVQALHGSGASSGWATTLPITVPASLLSATVSMLTDGAGNIIYENGDVIMVVGVGV